MATHVRAAAPLLHDSSRHGASQSRPLVVAASLNYLSLDARPAVDHFDDDGPGELSPFGPRHDNDHTSIKDIRILPTADECLAVRRVPYIPKKSIKERHHLEPGMPRLLDTLFRQLRYESTERLRDVCYEAAQDLLLDTENQVMDSYNHRRETLAERRYCAYRNARVEDIFADEQNGLIAQLSFDCPNSMRGQKMKSSGRLEEGMLCALVGIGDDQPELSITFFEINLRQSTFSMDPKGGAGLRAAVQVALAERDNTDDLLRITRNIQGLGTSRFVLVEFPGALYAGFRYHLKKLQELQTTDIAFSEQLAPRSQRQRSIVNSLSEPSPGQNLPFQNPPLLKPAYTSHPDYEVNLKPLTGVEQRLPITAFEEGSREATIEFLRDHSSLDDGQTVALCDTLSRDIAFTQGPPGTGKTFLGVALASTLLASRTLPHVKPVLVVCLTNHALDSFLKGLLDAGVDRIARVGGASREEWIKKHLLRSLARKMKLTDTEFSTKRNADLNRRNAFNELRSMCEAIMTERKTGVLSWFSVRSFLKANRLEIYEQLVTDIESSQAQSFTFQYWAGGGDLRHLKELELELKKTLEEENALNDTTEVQAALEKIQLHAENTSCGAETNVWSYGLEQRRELLTSWSREIDVKSLSHELVDLQLDYVEANTALFEARESIDVRCLENQNVIGMTTTACARRWSLLTKLDIQIVICEEAAEVMEPHTLCSMFQSVEHAIFIGDPLQLRPQIDEKLLKTEMNMGPEYRLDESLFEKFMSPKDPDILAMPVSQLAIQRRMHPDISQITRLTYPYLADHSATLSHPPTEGLARRMFWFDSFAAETSPLNSTTKSYTNDFEAAMVFGLVRYLLRGGAYALGEIAVITPYKGQLALLRKMFQGTCPVWLHPKDREALVDDGFLDETSNELREHVTMSEMLRMATVDNFQGEEARIIILTLVRSLKPGFLATENRVNVMCSRARDGLYIFGNARLLKGVPMWKDVLRIFQNHGASAGRFRTNATEPVVKRFRVDMHAPQNASTARRQAAMRRVLLSAARSFRVATIVQRNAMTSGRIARHVLNAARKHALTVDAEANAEKHAILARNLNDLLVSM
ncbi:MAG: hypothetical protein Q9227_007613 [Pyrenula ochraceoflavens]